MKHLGLSRAHGEVSSFASLRLAFWKNQNDQQQQQQQQQVDDGYVMKQSPIVSSTASQHESSVSMTNPIASSNKDDQDVQAIRSSASSSSNFLPNLPPPIKTTTTGHNIDDNNNTSTPLTPFDHQGSLRSSTESAVMRSPHHYAKEVFKSSTVPNDSNPVWGDDTNNNNNSNHNDDNRSNNNSSNFHIPLHKDDLLPTLQTDGGQISLEIRLDEEMAPTESLLVGGALTSAVNVASVATSMVGMGKQTREVSNMGREMLGLGSDRLIGRGVVDLMPLLVGLWEDDWEKDVSNSSSTSADHHRNSSSEKEEKEATLDMFGRIPHNDRMMRRRAERMGMLDVWVPLHHPSDAKNNDFSTTDGKEATAGKVHLLISYEPNGMSPKRDDVVALESFARCPFDQVNSGGDGNGDGGSGRNNNFDTTISSSINLRNVINPILPTLSPFLVIDIKGSYLLLEYATSRTVTSVDRLGNIKSSRWERTHRVRIHRNSVFVIERRTLLDVAGNIARLPGDIVLSTTVGQEIAEASAPVVAGALELMAPAFQSARLLMGAGSLGVKASLAGAKAASSAVVSVSQQKAMERREGVYVEEREGADSGVYRFG